MNEVVRDLEKFAHAYNLDDMDRASEPFGNHTIEKLQEFGLTAKMPNYISVSGQMAECTYLGHVVSGGQVKPEINKLEAVKNFPIPKTKKEVRSFLGLTGYYRHFVKDYASTTVPLTKLTRKECPKVVVWTEECDKALMP